MNLTTNGAHGQICGKCEDIVSSSVCVSCGASLCVRCAEDGGCYRCGHGAKGIPLRERLWDAADRAAAWVRKRWGKGGGK